MPATFSIELLRQSTLQNGRHEIEEWVAAADSPEVQARSPNTPLRNIGFAATRALLGGLFAFRLVSDAKAARSWFQTGDRLSATFISLVRSGLPATRWSGFELLHCNILAASESTARDLAECLSELQTSSAGPEEEITCLLALSILEQRESFVRRFGALEARFRRKAHPFHRHLFKYVAAHKAVLLRDQTGLDEAFEACREAYAATATDVALTGRRVHFGGGGQHAAVFDFMGTVVAILARRKGMSLTTRDDHIPPRLIDD